MSDVIIAEHNIVEKAEYGHLGWEVVSGRIVPYSEDLGVSPYFSNRIREKVNHQKACNVIFCGQPGVSKTYSAIEFGRYIQPDFRVEQVAYTYGEYMTLQINEPEGHIIVLDEPEYVAGHRDWFLDINKALVATTRSGRFKVHPLFIPCINKSLLDKVIRKYLVQFMVWLEDRGEAIVYEISPSRFDESVWNIPICNLRIEMMDVEKCDKLWCLSCPSFEDNSCQ